VVAVSWLAVTGFLLLMTIGINQFIRLAGSGTYDKYWPLMVTVAAFWGSFTQNFVQLLYIRRIYVMWGKLHIPLIAVVMNLYCLVQGFLFDTVMLNISLKRLGRLQQINWRILSIFSLTAAEDILITASLCYLIRRNRDNMFSRALRMVDKLTTWTVETGMITSLFALTVAITASITSIDNRYPGLWLGICVVGTTLYPLTYIFLLNGRTLLRSFGENNGLSLTSDLESEDMNMRLSMMSLGDKSKSNSDRTTSTALQA